jgi:hypothetical protein
MKCLLKPIFWEDVMKNHKKTKTKGRAKNGKKWRHENPKWQILMPDQIAYREDYAYDDDENTETILKIIGRARNIS